MSRKLEKFNTLLICLMRGSAFQVGAAIALTVAGILAYGNSFNGPFIFDDQESILENPQILRLWPLSKAMSAPPQSTVAGRPIASLSLAINYAVSGYSVWSYHFFNLLVHILAGLTLYGIIRRTLLCDRLRERFGSHSTVLAWAAAAIWLVHPIQTESVTYIVQRTESLMGLFYLLTLYSAIRSIGSPRPVLWQVGSVVCCGLGMGTKEVMVTAPVLVLLYDRAFVAGSFIEALRRRRGLYAALAATWLILAAILWSGPRSTSAGFSVGYKPLDYALNQCIVILHYIRLVLWPRGLCIDYSRLIVKDWGRILPPMPVILAMLAVTAWAVIRNRSWAYPAVWFFVVLSPSSSFVPIADLAFEHRMYLPLAGLVVLAVTAGYVLLNRMAKRFLLVRKFGYRSGIILLIVIVIVLSAVTLRRNNDYRSAMSIWQSVLDVTPYSTRAHNNLGLALQSLGEVDQAIKHYRIVLQLNPGEPKAYNNLGISFKSLGSLDEAVSCYRQAVLLKPDYAEAHNNLGNVLRLQGKLDEAISHFRQALRVKPESANIYFNLGLALQSQDKLDEAADCFRQAHRLHPDQPLPLNALATLLVTNPDPNMRDAKQAIEFAERAAALTGHQDATILNTLAAAYAAAGRFDKAATTAQQALELARTDRNDSLINQILERLERYRKAKPRT